MDITSVIKGKQLNITFVELCSIQSSASPAGEAARKWMIATGMWIQSIGIALFLFSSGFWIWLAGSILLGIGTALVYPTLLAAISDVAHPNWRGSAVGVYRLWRDAGYAVGALVAGLLADAFGGLTAIAAIGALTFLSGVIVALVMRETL